MKKFITLSFIIAAFSLSANNITVTNLSMVGQDITAGNNNAANFINVKFDLSWDNSWNQGAPTNNWDAAWVFVKYRVGTGDWHHAYLNNTGHTAAAGSQIDLGLLTPGSAFNAATNPAMGVFVRRSATGLGNVSYANMELKWNYRRNAALPVNDNDAIEVRVYAVEMVYVPTGSFYVGRHASGTESGAIKDGGVNTPYQITGNGQLIMFDISSQPFLFYGFSTTGDNKIGDASCLAGGCTVNALYPRGYSAYYSMKYEISQQQYVDFLNSLTRTQQNTRIATSIANAATSATNRYVMIGASGATVATERNGIRCPAAFTANVPIEFTCDLNSGNAANSSDDGQWLACNYLLTGDVAAYLGWSGLRPMTEFEYEKTCRGMSTPIVDEYPWGSSAVNGSPYTLSSSGAIGEVIASGYNVGSGNANFNGLGLTGPSRVGIFSVNNGSLRVPAGASFYGAMDMAGNVLETVVSLGNLAGFGSYTGVHGDGYLDASGNAKDATWAGFGFRGGAYGIGTASEGRIGDRTRAAAIQGARLGSYGGRGVRLAP